MYSQRNNIQLLKRINRAMYISWMNLTNKILNKKGTICRRIHVTGQGKLNDMLLKIHIYTYA